MFTQKKNIRWHHHVSMLFIFAQGHDFVTFFIMFPAVCKKCHTTAAKAIFVDRFSHLKFGFL